MCGGWCGGHAIKYLCMQINGYNVKGKIRYMVEGRDGRGNESGFSGAGYVSSVSQALLLIKGITWLVLA